MAVPDDKQCNTKDEYLAKYLREQAEREAEQKQEIQLLCAKRGIYLMYGTFDGSGDEGYFGYIHAYDAGKNEVVLTPEEKSDVEDYLCSVVPGGWENNEGASGHVVAYADGRIGGKIGWNVITVEYEDIGKPGDLPYEDMAIGKGPE